MGQVCARSRYIGQRDAESRSFFLCLKVLFILNGQRLVQLISFCRPVRSPIIIMPLLP